MGALPDWYPLMRAARYLGVPPWELLHQPSVWVSWALLAERVESEVQEELASRERAQAG